MIFAKHRSALLMSIIDNLSHRARSYLNWRASEKVCTQAVYWAPRYLAMASGLMTPVVVSMAYVMGPKQFHLRQTPPFRPLVACKL